MADIRWVKIRSWHAFAGITSRGGMQKTLCGRWAEQGAATAVELPGEKSCETCLRTAARRADRDS